MIQTKADYASPTTDVLELRVENVILITSSTENNPSNAYDTGWDLGSL